ncbi:hypothetical protein JCM3765_001283 [Sporobolomyces pararoseus]
MDSDNYTLSTEHLSLGLNSRGLTFHSLEVKSRKQPGSQATRDVLVGFEEQEAYRERLFFGSTVGRYANRLPAGKTTLKTGAEISLNGPNSVCLHGGDSGFDTLPWTPLNRPDSSLFPLDDPLHPISPLPSDPHAPRLESEKLFRLFSSSGNDGFPCTLETEALVVVQEEEAEEGKIGKVKVVLRSKIKEDGDKDIEKGTPVNLTVHWGFRLDDCLDSDILDHTLYIDSTELVSLDDKGLSTGSIDKLDQNGKGFDYHSKSDRKIGQDYPEGGIDRNFLLTPQKSSTPISPKPQLVLTAPPSFSDDAGPRLEIAFKTSSPSVQIYSAPGLDGSGPARKLAHQKKTSTSTNAEDGEEQSQKKGYEQNGALFIEFQQPVGTLSHTCAVDAKPENELKGWLEKRFDEMELGKDGQEEDKSWEKDSLLKRGQVWESWVEVEIKEL